MSTPIELTEWLEVETPQGRGYAIIFESDNDENFWTVILNETGAIVTFKQKFVKASPNYSWGRNFPHEHMAEILKK